MPPAIKFGTDGWRGVIARDFTFQNVNWVAHAAARHFEDRSGPKPRVPIGFDNRFLADQFAAETARVLSLYHYEPVLLSESVTSPLLSFITWTEKAPFGVMLTASHNPAEYCGFKVKGSFGGSIAQETAQEIEKRLPEVLRGPLAETPVHYAGRTGRYQDYFESYVKYLQKHVDFSIFKKSSARVVFDALYGPGGKITEGLFKRLKLKVRLECLHNHRDALFGGLHPEPIEEYLGDLKKATPKLKGLAGLSLDGDGDRLGLVDERGTYLTPQQAFSLLLYYLAQEKGLKGRVVQAVSLGYVSERIAQDLGLTFMECPVGFKYVAEEILKGDVLIGGEESGGYAFTRTQAGNPAGALLPERDGLLSALLIAEMVLSTRKPLSACLKAIEKRYGASCYLRNDIRLDRPIPDKKAFIEKIQGRFPSDWLGWKIREMRTLDGLKVILEDGSWFLIRPSGTEPLLRTYAEFPKREWARKSLEKLEPFVKDFLKSA